ncbi:MAG: hypothetical protein IPL40_01110 [Proteobacteria bacterium]|nr:hypothetical protein [Pseudomonadota bacterium]
MLAAARRPSTHARRDASVGALALLLAIGQLAACTTEAPWGSQGALGQGCYPEGTCERGGACLAGRCEAIGYSGRPSADGGGSLPPTCPGLARPQVDALATPTTQARVAISGKLGAPAVAVLIAGAGAQRLAPLPRSGHFCEELNLPARQTTRFEIVALDGQGCASAPTTVEVTHSPTAGSNVLAGIVPFANGEVRGALSRVSDGDVTTFSEFAFRERGGPGLPNSACDTASYVWFPLRAAAEISQFIVRYPPRESVGTRYLRCWSLLVNASTSAAIPRPAVGSAGWRAIGGMKDGSADDFLFSFPAQRVGQVALLLFEDGDDDDDESFAIAEIEALISDAGPAFVGCSAR